MRSSESSNNIIPGQRDERTTQTRYTGLSLQCSPWSQELNESQQKPKPRRDSSIVPTRTRKRQDETYIYFEGNSMYQVRTITTVVHSEYIPINQSIKKTHTKTSQKLNEVKVNVRSYSYLFFEVHPYNHYYHERARATGMWSFGEKVPGTSK